jgi:alkylation response protein AidB-like acyl-CoA dehydrogenase
MTWQMTPEQEMLRAAVRRLADEQLRPRAVEVDETAEFPWDSLRAMAKLGLCGLSIPGAFGGAAADAQTLCIVTEELARACPSTAAILMAFVVGAQPIVLAGTETQQRRYLPAIASGDKGVCIAITEPGAGSDVASITTTARRDGDHWVLDGTKALIGNVGPAEICVIAAKTDPGAGTRGISAFVVEKGVPGLHVGAIHSKMGLRGTVTGELVMDGCRVPSDSILGVPGRSFATLMQALDLGRLTAAAQCIGMAQAALEEAVSYSQKRVQFGHPLCDNQVIRFMLADMKTEIHAARSMLVMACARHAAGQPFAVEASMAKLFASEMANRVVHKALQIHGGWGYLKGATVERLHRDVRITEIYEGSSEVQRMIIARDVLAH